MLRLPGRTGIVVEPRDVERRLVPRRNEPLKSGGIGHPAHEFPFVEPRTAGEGFVETAHEGFRTARQRDQPRNVVLHVENMDTGIDLGEIAPGAEPVAQLRIERFDPFAPFVSGCEITDLRIP